MLANKILVTSVLTIKPKIRVVAEYIDKVQMAETSYEKLFG